MNFVNFNRAKASNKPGFSFVFDDLEKSFQDIFNGGCNTEYSPSLNIVETKDAHRMEIAAPGLKKEDFDLNIEKDILSISVKVEKAEKEEEEKYLRREFSFKSFKRSFQLPETTDRTAIAGKYEDGVLYVTLPKKEEAKEVAPRKVEIV